MGSTLVGTVWRGGSEMFLTHLGDSRAYLMRDKLEQLTQDHDIVRALVDAGRFRNRADALQNRVNHVLYRWLGSQDLGNEPAVQTVAIQPGDRLLLSTDGLHTMVPEDRLLHGARSGDVQQCADALAQSALDLGSRDNISCIVIEVVSAAGLKDRSMAVVPRRWPSALTALAAALRDGDDCAFALHDALLEAGHDELAEHFTDGDGKDHSRECWALNAILG
jgi:protein phosphatase